MADMLTYGDAKEIYDIIKKNVDRTDEDIVDLYNDMIARAIKYANARAIWSTMDRKQRIDFDSTRSAYHDAYIASINIVARLEGDIGAAWRERLSDDRKRIGDLACYIALFEAIENR